MRENISKDSRNNISPKYKRCTICALSITFIVLSAALIYFNTFDPKLLNEYLNVDTLILIVCIIFILFTAFLLFLVWYCMSQNKKIYPDYNDSRVNEQPFNIHVDDSEVDSSLIQELKFKNDQISDELTVCKLNMGTIQKENQRLTKANNVLKKEIEEMNTENERQEQKYEAKIKNLKADFENKQQEMTDKCEEYKQQIIEWEEMKEKPTISPSNISDEELIIANETLRMRNQTLSDELNKLQRDYEELEKHRNQIQDRLCDLNPNVLSVTSNFPTVQDMVVKFDTLRGQNRQNCAKKVKKYFKKLPINANVTKYWLSKQANQLLFQILMDCYKKMKDYYVLVNKRYDNDNTDKLNKMVYFKLRKEFESLFDEIKSEYTNDVIQSKLDQYKGINNFCDKNVFVEYVEECLFICWFINVSQSPPLKFYPNDDEKDNEGYVEILKQSNNDIYEYVSGSEENESLNYYVWPAIIRIDNNFLLSKIYGFFSNNIPQYKK